MSRQEVKGDLLFRIDDRDDTIVVHQAGVGPGLSQETRQRLPDPHLPGTARGCGAGQAA